MEEGYFDPIKISIRKIEKSIAKEMIIKYHYSHNFPFCMVAYGIFYITNKPNEFFGGCKEKLIVYTVKKKHRSGTTIETTINIADST